MKGVSSVRVRLRTSVFVMAAVAGGLVTGAITDGIINVPTVAASTVPTNTLQIIDAGQGGASAVTCPTTGSCVAVGGAFSSAGPGGALFATLANGTWTQTLNYSQGLTLPVLNGVWCATVVDCIAVGLNNDGDASAASPLIETIDNGTWTAVTSGLLPAGAVTGVLEAISCLSMTSCVAVGSYTDESGDSHALFETLSGTTWSPSTAPDPVGSAVLGVTSVQCFTTSSCEAVGYWGPNETTENGLVETLSGTTWTPSTVQSGVLLRSIWCASESSCLAVGYSSGTTEGVTETLSGSTWTNGTLPGLGDGGTPNGIVGVSCVGTVTNCVAVGGWRPPAPDSSEPLALFETLSGGTWTPEEVAEAPNGSLDDPEGISCPLITSCVAVGGAITPTATTEPAALTDYTHGYWLVGSDGGVFSFGSAQFYGSTGSIKLNKPVVGIVATADRGGYWLDASDGGVFSFGNTQFYGSVPGILKPGQRLNAPIVGMVPSVDDHGYFMVGADGGVFAFGDAQFEGSCPALPGGCSGAAVAVMPDTSGKGYWLVTATGNIYTFGDTKYDGAPGNTGSPVTSAVRTPDGGGYWILTANGTIYSYGDAQPFGAPTGQFGGLNPATAIFATGDGGGYWVASANGTVDAFGDASNDGGANHYKLNGPIITASGS
jgi:hypothetical protein